ncbi:hypothetical protein [Streptomyces sp. PT12]|uniref:hypothetical protein n=1 Tax=Streptomyces sp. PT12 TaxID=1510197 RepID=UPI0011BE9073|nr:hypothetical protein [Streptomyces sp. PT12]
MREFLRESDGEQRRRDGLMEAGEAHLERCDRTRHPLVDCEMAISSTRERLAVDSATRYRNAAREFVSWWADAAAVALAAAAGGAPVTSVRLGAGNPALPMDEKEVAQLPEVDRQTRQMVELAAWLGPTPAHGGPERNDLMAEALGLASRSGLLIHREGGDVKVIDDPWPEARRRRLWGEFWTEHRIPRLPSPNELADLLAGAAPDTVERVHSGAMAVGRAVRAESRVEELNSQAEDWTREDAEEFDRLCDQVDGLTGLLAAYAGLLTDSLPEVRAATHRRTRAGAGAGANARAGAGARAGTNAAASAGAGAGAGEEFGPRSRP